MKSLDAKGKSINQNQLVRVLAVDRSPLVLCRDERLFGGQQPRAQLARFGQQIHTGWQLEVLIYT